MSLNREKKQKLNTGLAILFGILCLACIIWLMVYLVQTLTAEEKNEQLKEEYVTEEETTEATSVEESVMESDVEEASTEENVQEAESESSLEGFDVPEKTIDFAALKEENEHIYAWITVPGTKVDYPVLQHPEEMDYYLDHNLDHSSGYPGCVYSQVYNAKDWEDNNTVLYGHNMKNGTMFGSLHYFEDPEFFDANQYVYVYTEDGQVRVYQIFAAYEFSNAHLLLSFDMKTPENYEAYLQNIFNVEGLNNHFNTEIELTAEDKIITLSTCINRKPDKRYLVQAVLVAQGEQ